MSKIKKMLPLSCSFVPENGNCRSFRLPFSAAVPFSFCIVYRSVLFRFIRFCFISFMHLDCASRDRRTCEQLAIWGYVHF
jgi:hypothetical protein